MGRGCRKKVATNGEKKYIVEREKKRIDKKIPARFFFFKVKYIS